MSPTRIGRHLSGGPEPEDEGRRRAAESVREAFARWASGVTLLAVRDGGRVHALTVSAFIPLSFEPPLVLASLGPNASAAPFLDPGAAFGVSILTHEQRGLASRYADTFPVGPLPFTQDGVPLVPGALATFSCTVEEVLRRGDHDLVVGRVAEATAGGESSALVYFRRAYHRVV